jgi:hypothetical protein
MLITCIEAAELLERVDALAVPLQLMLQQSPSAKQAKIVALTRLQACLTDIKTFCDTYLKKSFFQRARNAVSAAVFGASQQIAGLVERLHRCLMDLQVGQGADIHAAVDALRDEMRRLFFGRVDRVENLLQVSTAEKAQLVRNMDKPECLLGRGGRPRMQMRILTNGYIFVSICFCLSCFTFI